MIDSILGFDIRLRAAEYVESRWTKENREQYLIRVDIEWPWSIDEYVWPSKFRVATPNEQSPPYRTINVEATMLGENYWSSLKEMKRHFDANRKPEDGGISVAIHLFSDGPPVDTYLPYKDARGIACAFVVEATDPEKDPPGSSFEGYDIATAGGCSGLMDWRIDPRERSELETLWGPRLNAHGLMERLNDALAYKAYCEKREPFSAPFWVYGISILQGASE